MLRTVLLLARDPGIEVLKAVFADSRTDVMQVYTPSYLPKAEGGGPRPEARQFDAICLEHDTPCHRTGHGENNLFLPECDLLLVCNWRDILTADQLGRARRAINIHRGELPAFPGGRPVRQAILAGKSHIAITAHEMVPEVDAGPPLAMVWNKTTHNMQGLIDAGSDSALDQAEKWERSALMPQYAPLTRLVLEMVR